MSHFYEEFTRALAAHRLFPDHINLTEDVYYRFKSRGICKSKCCGYRIFPGRLGAHFFCFRRDISEIWFSGSHKNLTLYDRIAIERERERIRHLQLIRRQQAQYRACRFWHSITVDDYVENHPYIVRKQIRPIYAKAIQQRRAIKQLLVLPVRNILYELQTVQIIKANGFKRLYKGTTATDNMIWLSGDLPYTYNGVIRVCEGYATGVTIWMATQEPTICAINAHNYERVAILLKKRFPQAILKLCADNDCWGEDNPGMRVTIAASYSAHSTLYWPEFEPRLHCLKPTDFNDLMIYQGIEEVRKHLYTIKR